MFSSAFTGVHRRPSILFFSLPLGSHWMLDGVMLRMVEEATHAGYPVDAAAVLLIELEGIREAVEAQVEQVRQACTVCGAREFRVARTAEERDLLWKGRKNAFGAVGRVSPAL